MNTTDIPMAKVLVMMVGLPRSGKSTAARQLATIHNGAIVCPDEIRYALYVEAFLPEREVEVWQIAHVMVKALFGAGHNTVILDACNNTIARRAEWIDPLWKRVMFSKCVPAEECKRRAKEEYRDELIPIIDRMDAAHEPVTLEECAG